ncbi:MAG: transcriptional regulator, Crp/Fnr family [Bryobacterales bacterium]|nr:transcriptional regulator, Crp/Fnr family [Bryobacterales bacterium]
MENGPATTLSGKILEDPLAYLPCSAIHEYGRGQTIYGQSQPSTSVYLVIAGKIKVFRLADNGSQVVIDIYPCDEFFGESAFLELSDRGTETAVALENTKVMAWTTGQIEDIAARRPQLAIGLLQLFVQRSVYLEQRIESLSVDPIGRRLAQALLRFSERMGRQTEDGWVEITAFTHELLGQYVGTSREIVTHSMNQFRRQGYLRYSRKSILLRPEMVRDRLRAEPQVA